MSPMLTRQRTIFTRRYEDKGCQWFGVVDDDDSTTTGYEAHRYLAISTDDWLEMGEPEELTVTVEPGDLLNG